MSSELQFNRLIPELSVSDFERSLAFYVETLGFRVEYARPEDRFAFLSLQGSQLMIEQCNGHWETGVLEAPFGRGINFQIEVDDLEPLLAALRLRSHGLKKDPWESWYRQGDVANGQREFLVQDPDGYLLRFCQFLGTRPA